MSGPRRAGLDEMTARRDAEYAALLRGDAREAAFTKPWELRAFAVAVAAHEAAGYEWSEFQQSLIESIRSWEDEVERSGSEPWSYYEHWLTALESVLVDRGTVAEADVDERMHEILCTPRDPDHHQARTEPLAVDPARV